MKQCEKGHFYDEKRYGACPYCNPAAAPAAGKTVALKDEPNRTMPISPAQREDRGKTVGFFKSDIGIDPAVGFIVCISGPMKGADFKLRSGRNFIGRSASMDVALTDDDTVSRENHALIIYDAKHNKFMLSPGMGRGITYKNGDQVETAVEISAYDRIEAGKCELIFVPLCCESFIWDSDKL